MKGLSKTPRRTHKPEGAPRRADATIRQYVAALEAENAKLHRQVAKLEVQDLSNRNRIDALEKELEDNRPKVNFSINTGAHETTEAELIERMRALGYRIEKLV
jgi:hypothetical protein